MYRAIAMHLGQFHWEKALELAVKQTTHVDTVILRRNMFLASMGRKEFIPAFMQYRTLEIDEAVVAAKVREEEEKERSRPGAKPYITS